MSVDHRAEAEKRLGWAAGNEEPEWALVNATIGLAHATLAGPTTRSIEFVSAPPVADSGWQELLTAARGVLDNLDFDIDGDDWAGVSREHIEELARCVQEATEAGQ